MIGSASVFNKFKCIYTNIDGISNKVDVFQLYINQEKPHIILLTETKLMSADLSLDYFKVPSYTVYRKDRNSRYRGGGVAILIHNSIASEQIVHNFFNTETGL